MFHCGKFRASNIWFLDDTLDYTDRRLQLGICPQCHREVGELFEKRKSDGLVRSTRLTRRKLDRLKEEEKYNIQYTSQDINKQTFKKKLSGGCMGLIQQSRVNLVWHR
jgi:hypothetical protein